MVATPSRQEGMTGSCGDFALVLVGSADKSRRLRAEPARISGDQHEAKVALGIAKAEIH